MIVISLLLMRSNKSVYSGERADNYVGEWLRRISCGYVARCAEAAAPFQEGGVFIWAAPLRLGLNSNVRQLEFDNF
jgi:hypothetical protein